MVKRNDLINFIHKTIGRGWLEKAMLVDEMANGAQILGEDNVNKVALGVSLSENFLKEAVNSGAEFCIFHHGLDILNSQVNSRLSLSLQKRLKYIFENNLTIAGFHYCLDAHPKIGNNALIIQKLGARIKEPFFEGWGYIGEFEKPQDIKKLSEKCAKIFEHDVFAVFSGVKKIKRIGVCSGGGKPNKKTLFELIDKDVELHITGEIAEGGPALAKEMGFNYFACGHYATEAFGVQELGKRIKAYFKDKLEVEFIDIPNIV